MNGAPFVGSTQQATRLDALRGHFDPWLLGIAIALACFGLVMVASSSIAIGEGLGVGPFYFLTRHVLFLAIGIGLAVWLMRTELKLIEQQGQWLLLACFVLLLLVFVPGIGRTVNGARRWLNLGVANFQVVEVVKLLYIIWLASYLKRFSEEVIATWRAMLKPLGVEEHLPHRRERTHERAGILPAADRVERDMFRKRCLYYHRGRGVTRKIDDRRLAVENSRASNCHNSRKTGVTIRFELRFARLQIIGRQCLGPQPRRIIRI